VAGPAIIRRKYTDFSKKAFFGILFRSEPSDHPAKVYRFLKKSLFRYTFAKHQDYKKTAAKNLQQFHSIKDRLC
jgi:hypothetical protein